MEHKGAKNRYDCQVCAKSIITINADDGTTPFMISCRATKDCNGAMYSAMYVIPQTLLPGFEWFKPKSLKGYDRYDREHVRKGGLILRKL